MATQNGVTAWKEKTGVLIAWKEVGGFGFLQPDDGMPDVFVSQYEFQRAGIIATINIGEQFVFTIKRDREGRAKATRLRRAALEA